MNSLPADLGVTEPGKSIDTLEELVENPLFANNTPTILATLNMFSALSKSRDGTIEQKLFDRVMENENK